MRVARGDETAFGPLYDLVSAAVFGLVRQVLCDQAQSEEVFQEVMLEVWRTASRFDPERGQAMTWILTMTHRRAVDRVRSAQAAAHRDELVAMVGAPTPLRFLTGLQRESLMMAYYQGCSCLEVAGRLGVPLETVRTRMREGLISLRDCSGVTA
ncbi:sigma factor [Lentzea sp. NPDC058450]|uniref:sigma factor n=1 Tax=Lentzea sp. NPDC058450 TaxID=3346505 RepID=UPI0036461060